MQRPAPASAHLGIFRYLVTADKEVKPPTGHSIPADHSQLSRVPRPLGSLLLSRARTNTRTHITCKPWARRGTGRGRPQPLSLGFDKVSFCCPLWRRGRSYWIVSSVENKDPSGRGCVREVKQGKLRGQEHGNPNLDPKVDLDPRTTDATVSGLCTEYIIIHSG